MDELIRLHKNITNLVNNWDVLINKFLLEFEPLFIDIVNEQLDKGQDGDGDNLFPEYGFMYNAFKKSIGSSSAPIPDLKVSGDWRDGFKMLEDFTIISTDWKDSMLRQRYGNEITDIQTGNMNELINEDIMPEFQEFIYKKIFN